MFRNTQPTLPVLLLLLQNNTKTTTTTVFTEKTHETEKFSSLLKGSEKIK